MSKKHTLRPLAHTVLTRQDSLHTQKTPCTFNSTQNTVQHISTGQHSYTTKA